MTYSTYTSYNKKILTSDILMYKCKYKILINSVTLFGVKFVYLIKKQKKKTKKSMYLYVDTNKIITKLHSNNKLFRKSRLICIHEEATPGVFELVCV